MEALIQALSGLLLKAVPTIILLIFVHFYLKIVLFRPLQEIRRKRREATEGTLQAAQKNRELAAEKAAMYDLALKEARAEMYREQEEAHRQWLEQQTSRIEEARQHARAIVKDAAQKLDAEVAEARRDLASRSQMLALQIVETLTSGKRAA
jgi:F-type H+-transporting ATPase subunit b